MVTETRRKSDDLLLYTGTGNSLYVAKKLDTQLYSIPQIIHSETITYADDSIGMACVQACPQMAVQFTINERNPKARYRNEHVSLSELVAANEQTFSYQR